MDDVLPFVTLRVGARELLGFPSSWRSAVRRIERYSLAEVLDVLGRISVVLDKLGPTRFSEAGILILRGLMGPGSTAERAFARIAEQRGGRVAVFDELQLVTAAKLALMVLPVSDARTSTNWVDLGRALLIINNLVDEAGGAPDGPPSNEASRQQWNQYLMANGFFHSDENDLAGFGRARALYFDLHSDLADHHRYVDLPKTFEQVTGLPPGVLSAFFFALNGNWQTVKLEDIPAWTSSVHRYDYLSANYDFDQSEIDGVLTLFSAPAQGVKAEMQHLYQLDSMQAYHVLPLARSPLIGIGDRLYCPSVQLLKRRFTRGLYHLFLTAEDPNVRQRFLDFMGAVFDAYVTRLLHRTYDGTSARVVPEKALREAIGTSVCDGLVFKDGVVVLVEAKAPMFSLSATSGASWPDFEGKARRVFVDGCAQLSSTIDAIEAGALDAHGIEASAITSYVPLVVTLDDIPLQPVTYNEIDSWVTERGVLHQPKSVPWQAIHIGELEGWEVMVRAGRDLHAIARAKATGEHVSTTFTNYWLLRGISWEGHNPDVASSFRRLTDEVEAFFARRKRGGAIVETL